MYSIVLINHSDNRYSHCEHKQHTHTTTSDTQNTHTVSQMYNIHTLTVMTTVYIHISEQVLNYSIMYYVHYSDASFVHIHKMNYSTICILIQSLCFL